METLPIKQKEQESAPPAVDINEGALRNPKEWRNKELVPEKKIEIQETDEIKNIKQQVPQPLDSIEQKINSPSVKLPEVTIKDLLAGANASEMINQRQAPNEMPTGKEIVGARLDEKDINDTTIALSREISSSFEIFTLLNQDIITNPLRFPSPQFPLDKLISFSRLFTDKVIKKSEKENKFNEGGPISK